MSAFDAVLPCKAAAKSASKSTACSKPARKAGKMGSVACWGHMVMSWSCWGWLSMLIWKVSSYAGGLFVISWRACVLKLKGRALVHPCPLLMDSAPENSSKKPLPAADKQRVSAGDMLPAQASG